MKTLEQEIIDIHDFFVAWFTGKSHWSCYIYSDTVLRMFVVK